MKKLITVILVQILCLGSNLALAQSLTGYSGGSLSNKNIGTGSSYIAPVAGGTCSGVTLNPSDASPGHTFSNGNLTATTGGVYTNGAVRATAGVSSGKKYWEVKSDKTISYMMAGIAPITASNLTYFGTGAKQYYSNTGGYYTPGPGQDSGITATASWNGVHTLGVALDMDAGTLKFYVDNSSQGTVYTGLSGTYYPWFVGLAGDGNYTVTFDTASFTYTPPSGYSCM